MEITEETEHSKKGKVNLRKKCTIENSTANVEHRDSIDRSSFNNRSADENFLRRRFDAADHGKNDQKCSSGCLKYVGKLIEVDFCDDDRSDDDDKSESTDDRCCMCSDIDTGDVSSSSSPDYQTNGVTEARRRLPMTIYKLFRFLGVVDEQNNNSDDDMDVANDKLTATTADGTANDRKIGNDEIATNNVKHKPPPLNAAIDSSNKNNNNNNEAAINNSVNKSSDKCSINDNDDDILPVISHSDDDDEMAVGRLTKNSDNYKVLLSFNEAPFHLRFNQFIKRGYRGYLPFKVCVDSVFWLTNESVNIWSHFFGWLLFLGLMFYDLFLLNIHASLADKFLVGGLLICFQFCMIASALYHTFNCHSEHHFQCFLRYDLFGIACSLLAIYLSGIYYAFWCNVEWCLFYIGTILLIFILVLLIQIFHDNPQLKLISFVSWAAFGVVPTIHWTFTMGGWGNPIVQKLLPRVINMYIISGAAFGIYATYVPERFFPGRFDFIGSSHQLWHIFVVIALYYWHNTGINYIEYRMSHSCLAES